MKRTLLFLFALALGCSGSSNNQPQRDVTPTCAVPQPPVAERDPVEHQKHGTTWSDPYHWLRDREKPETIAYLEAENTYAEQRMSHLQNFQDQLYEEMLSHVEETDLSAPYRYGDYWYYTRTEEGKSYEIYCRKEGSLDAPEEILLDENKLAQDHEYLAVGAMAPSPNGKLLAYSTDTKGNERYSLVVKNLETGELVGEPIPDVYYSVAWANDNKTLFYNRVDDANRPHQLYRHTLGTSPDDDALVYEEEDDRFFLSLDRTRSEKMLLMSLSSAVTTEVHYLSADEPKGDFQVVAPRQQDVEYWVEHHSDRFYIRSNEEAVNFRLFEASVDQLERAQWKELIPPRDKITLQDVDAFQNHLVIWERRDALPRVRVRNLETGEEHEVEFPEPTYAVRRGENYEFDTPKLRFNYSSLTTPRSVFDYNMNNRTRELIKENPVPGYDRSQYVSARLDATASDGAKIPISLVWKKGAREDGPAPLMLFGYGSYGSSYDPYFSPSRLALLDRGVIVGIAHVRGGGEKGRTWYEDGKYLKKKNTFTDFVAAAEHLVAEGWTSPEQLGASGRSAGGLLMGAVMNLRPELFSVILAGVPFVDVLNTMLDPSIPLTVIEWEEWGNPNEKAYFEYMKSYAPYENVRETEYPNTLVTAGLNDPRVAYWEPAKWVARLRHRSTGDSELLLRTNMGAGHGGSSDRYAYLRDLAFEYAFALQHLGAIDVPSRCR